jgi:hypothetical protein
MCSEVTRQLSAYALILFCSRLTKLTIPSKDVDWHATKESVFASVGDDKMLMMYELPILNMLPVTHVSL